MEWELADRSITFRTPRKSTRILFPAVPSNHLIGQPRVQDAIGHAVTSGRMAQSYLFHGPEGTGKRAAAIALAQALLCENSSRNADGVACGKCLSCTKVQRGLHADVHVYLPHPRDTRTEDIAERIQLLFENPYRLVDFKRRPSLDDAGKISRSEVIYYVDYLDAIVKESHFVPVEERYNIGILVDADRMNDTSANKFLKMLEEPPERTVLILTAERTDRMLPTILSRCQHIRFDPLQVADIEHTLTKRERISADRAAFVARMADGSYTNALELLGNDQLAAQRQLALEFIRQSVTRRADKVLPVLEEISKLGRETVGHVFRLMLSWVRDVVLFEAAGDAAPLVNVDQIETVRKFVSVLPNARPDAMVGYIEEAAILVNNNSNVALTLTVLADALADGMNGIDRKRLVEPLDSLMAATA